MKPIFTLHAGEYLVGTHIEQTFKSFSVWIPSRDTGIDLLVTDRHHKCAVAIQVKFSKDFVVSGAKCFGWWKFNRDKMKNSTADLWVLVLYTFNDKSRHFLVAPPRTLLEILSNLYPTDEDIQSYIMVTHSGRCWETRGLPKPQYQQIVDGCFDSPERDLGAFLDNWEPLTSALGLS
jgi:hypothetical protein